VIQVRRNRQVGRPWSVKDSDLVGLRSKEGTYRGRDFVVLRIRPRPSGGALRVYLPGVHPVRALRVTYQYGLDRFAERIGFSSIIPSGDEAFDKSVLVDTDRDAGERLLQKPEVRRAFAQLLAFGDFKLGGNGLELRIQNVPGKIDEDGTPVDLLDRLIAAAELLEAAGFVTRGGREPESGGAIGAIVIYGGIAAMAGIIYQYSRCTTPLTSRSAVQLFHQTLLWGGAPVLLALGAYARRVVGLPDAHVRLLAACSLVPLCAGIAIATGLCSYDQWAGDSPPRSVEVLVIKTSEAMNQVTVASWHVPDATEQVEFPRNQLQGLHPGASRLKLEVTEGALGYERVTAASILKR